MSQPVQPRPAAVPCTVCDKSFRTREALTAHAIAKDHPYCKQCRRLFKSATALDEHRQHASAHARTRAPAQPPAHPVPIVLPPVQNQFTTQSQAAHTGATVSPTPAPASPIVHRGNTYTRLSDNDMAALHALLLARCHTPQRLRSEKYPLPADHLATLTTTKHGTTPLYVPTPRHDPSIPKRKAVVLDCEMVGITASRLDDEVVRVSVLDFFTAQPLLDTLVRPNRRVADWRAGITGVSAKAMARAALGGEVLLGKEAAREALAEHVDENTVVVGHSVGCDLRALGVVHGRIVDSAILTAEPAFGEGKKLGNVVGLERLCRELLGLRIRGGAPAAGGRCHDSLEDVLATRELVVWCLRNPRDLEAWAVKNWGPGKKGRKKSGPRKRKLGGSDARSWSEDEDEDEEVLRWEDVVDWEVWPKSPPDYSD